MSWTTPTARSGRFALYRDPHPARIASFAEDVRTGLGMRPYTLSPRYFYDDLGSALFDAITRLPEYYLTRVERDLLATYGSQIVAAFDEPLELVELGSGSAAKTRLIIEAILARQERLTFHPIDISPEALIESSHGLLASHEALTVSAYASDYFALLRAQRLATRGRVLALYLGSNVGNFEPTAARELFSLLGDTLQAGDGLLVGFDLKKDASVLELAYNDPTGVTAAFNKNLLARINRELGGDFDLVAFSFAAQYDAPAGAIRSYLRAERAMTVTVPGAGVTADFAAGETIHTESSYKFAVDDMLALLAAGGFVEHTTFVDNAGRYALALVTRT
jgi:L-histidine N-alpha-methyltransferase